MISHSIAYNHVGSRRMAWARVRSRRAFSDSFFYSTTDIPLRTQNRSQLFRASDLKKDVAAWPGSRSKKRSRRQTGPGCHFGSPIQFPRRWGKVPYKTCRLWILSKPILHFGSKKHPKSIRFFTINRMQSRHVEKPYKTNGK